MSYRLGFAVKALEAKAKDLALLRLREQLEARGFGWRAGRLVPGGG